MATTLHLVGHTGAGHSAVTCENSSEGCTRTMRGGLVILRSSWSPGPGLHNSWPWSLPSCSDAKTITWSWWSSARRVIASQPPGRSGCAAAWRTCSDAVTEGGGGADMRRARSALWRCHMSTGWPLEARPNGFSAHRVSVRCAARAGSGRVPVRQVDAELLGAAVCVRVVGDADVVEGRGQVRVWHLYGAGWVRNASTIM
jgi:hypothetical protein